MFALIAGLVLSVPMAADVAASQDRDAVNLANSRFAEQRAIDAARYSNTSLGEEPRRTTRPTFYMHGIAANGGTGDGLRQCLASSYWHNLEAASDSASWTTSIPDTAAQMKDMILTKVREESLDISDGINLICHSQGGVACRYLISTWHEHPIKAFVSLAGPQMGVQGFGTLLSVLPQWVINMLSSTAINNAASQNHLPFANYWHDRTTEAQEVDFRRYSRALAPMNNEVPLERCQAGGFLNLGCTPESNGCARRLGSAGLCNYPGDESGFHKEPLIKDNFERLSHAVFLGSPADEAIVPWQSSVWGYYAAGSGANTKPAPTFEAWDETYVHQQDLVPLQKMMDDGKLTIGIEEDALHNDWVMPVSGCALAAKYYADLL